MTATTDDRSASTELAAFATSHGLMQLGGRPPLLAYIKELWQRRHFALELAKSKVRSQNEQDRLGLGWVVLTPLINAAVYGFIFGVLLASGSSRPENFLAFLVCGVFTFAFFTGCFQDGARAIVSNRGLVRTLHFPRAVLPLATVLQKLLELGAQVFVMCAIVLLTGERPTWRWLMLVPVFITMALFCAGIAFIAARLTIHIRDIAQLIPFITRLIFYVSGIFFSIEKKFSASPNLEAVLKFNPLNIYITLVRGCLMTPQESFDKANGRTFPVVTAINDNWQVMGAGLLWGVALFVAGFIFFWRAEGLYGRE